MKRIYDGGVKTKNPFSFKNYLIYDIIILTTSKVLLYEPSQVQKLFVNPFRYYRILQNTQAYVVSGDRYILPITKWTVNHAIYPLTDIR